MKDPATRKNSPKLTTYIVAHGNPQWSRRIPAAEGPTKAPSAKVDVHRPDTSPYVLMLSLKPLLMASEWEMTNEDTRTAPLPQPCSTRAATHTGMRVGRPKNGAGPRKEKAMVVAVTPRKLINMGLERKRSEMQPKIGAVKAYVPPFTTNMEPVSWIGH